MFREITDSKSLRHAMQGCEQVYHTAATAKMWCSNKNEFYKVNVEGTRKILQAALTAGVIKIVHTSTCGVIGPAHKLTSHRGFTEFTIHRKLVA